MGVKKRKKIILKDLDLPQGTVAGMDLNRKVRRIDSFSSLFPRTPFTEKKNVLLKAVEERFLPRIYRVFLLRGSKFKTISKKSCPSRPREARRLFPCGRWRYSGGVGFPRAISLTLCVSLPGQQVSPVFPAGIGPEKVDLHKTGKGRQHLDMKEGQGGDPEDGHPIRQDFRSDN